MNRTSIELGYEAVKDEAYFQETIQKIVKTRERAKERLAKLGFHFPEPSANFIFAEHERIPAAELFAALREKDIYVRHFNGPRVENSLRITIGTEEEMEELYQFLDDYIRKRL